MMTYSFEYTKNHSDNTASNDRIIVCDDQTFKKIGIHDHLYYEIEYIFNGEGMAVLNDTSFIIKRGDVIIIPAHHTHSYLSTNSLCVVNICFLPSENQKILVHEINHIINLTEFEQIEFESLYYLIKSSLLSNHKQKDNKADDYLNAILKVISLSHSKNDIISGKWNKLMLYITDNYETVDTKKAAEIMHLSLGTFCRYFKQSFDEPFTEFIDNIRLEKAKNYLQAGEMNIEEISYKVGFSHPTRFYKKFKEYYSITPKQYSNQIQKS